MKLISETEAAITCAACRHYSFVPATLLPYRCQALDFQGKQSPGAVIFATTEAPCRLFTNAKRTGPKS